MSKKIKIVADDKIPFLKGALDDICEMVYLPAKEITKDKIIDADALIIRTRTICNESLLKGTSVKFIATATIGYDHIDTQYCKESCITWTNAPGCNSSSVMQYIASALFTLRKKQKISFDEVALGVIGVGNVGSKVVSLAEKLNIRVYLNDPPRERAEKSCQFISLEGIVRECNIITFHVPLTKEGIDKTFHMADDDFFSALNPGTIVINSSRGEVINTNALKKAIKSKKLNAVVLDVWENEPMIDRELLDLVDIGTPHIAGYSADGKANGTAMSVQAISKFFNLGRDNWYPENVPIPENHQIIIDCKNKDINDILSEIILFTYDLTEDDKKLRSNPDSFEKLRENYPIRREFNSYEIKLTNCNDNNIPNTIKNLGFKLI